MSASNVSKCSCQSRTCEWTENLTKIRCRPKTEISKLKLSNIKLKSSGKINRKVRKDRRKSRRKNRKFGKNGPLGKRSQKIKTLPWCVSIRNGKKDRVRNKNCACPKGKVSNLNIELFNIKIFKKLHLKTHQVGPRKTAVWLQGLTKLDHVLFHIRLSKIKNSTLTVWINAHSQI